MMNLLYLRHKLTAYHWRYDRRKSTSLAICTCGWNCRAFRPGVKLRLKGLVCRVIGHNLGEVETAEAGPIDFEEGEGDVMWRFRQCERCYQCVNEE